jgi:hypothetical protein
MKKLCGIALLLGMAVVGPSEAAENVAPASAREHLAQYAQANVPADWKVRVSQRDQVLVVFVTPPTSEGFSLIYDTNASLDLVRKLCPPPDNAIWSEIAPASDIAVTPTILGKTGVRSSCKATAAESAGG